MRIGFVDPSGWDYTTEAPLDRPFGGSQSALVYLAVELARLGHSVTIFNDTVSPKESQGVDIRNLYSALQSSRDLNALDVVVVVNLATGRVLRRTSRVTPPMVLWTQHAQDEEAMQELKSLVERKSWTNFVFVSEWQRRRYVETFGIRPERTTVLRNAASPAFLKASNGPAWFETGDPPVLFYTSTPFRGLDVLLAAFPVVREAIPGTRLRVFSSMGVYQVAPQSDAHARLYDQAKATPGVEYSGSVGQRQLASELSGAAALAYPSTFAETSCISLIEALAMGAAVFSTDLGAIPETSDGHALLTPWTRDKSILSSNFADLAIGALRDMQQNPSSAASQRNERQEYVHERYTWPLRAREWAEWLPQMISQQSSWI